LDWLQTGYTLMVRKLMVERPDILNEKVRDETFLDAALRPHKCYYQCLRELFAMSELHGLAHITGGGMGGNLNRILPEGLDARVDLSKIQVLPVFKVIREAGNIPDSEMMRTFNMGIGVTLVAKPPAIEEIRKHLAAKGCSSYVIGEVIEGNQTVRFKGELS